MIPPSLEIQDAMAHQADEQLSEEQWLVPGVRMCLGRRFLYLDPGDGKVGLVPLRWIPIEEVRRDLKMLDGLSPAERRERDQLVRRMVSPMGI